MSEIFDRLTQLFEQGHARDVGELMSDSRFADLDRTADAAVLIAVTERIGAAAATRWCSAFDRVDASPVVPQGTKAVEPPSI